MGAEGDGCTTSCDGSGTPVVLSSLKAKPSTKAEKVAKAPQYLLL